MIDKHYGRAILLLLFITLLSTPAVRSTNAPVLFFADLQSGPNSGGESVSGFAGAYVTLYGNFLGATQGSSTVMLGGNNCLRVVSWGTPHLWYQKIVVQLGSTCSSGSFVVSVAGQTSNALSFTVRRGNIFCVSTSGSDSKNGHFPSSCWATIPRASSGMVAGDITYVRQGVVASGDNGYGSPLNNTGKDGTAVNPYALIVYPGESAQIGGSTNGRGIIQYPAASAFWTVSGFVIVGGRDEAIHLSGHSFNWRILANSITCPIGSGSTGCVTADGASGTVFLGNDLHDTGNANSVKTYHAYYFGDLGGTLTHDLEVGWNTVRNIQACRGIMFHPRDDLAGSEAYNLQVHDNVIHDVRCDGILFGNTNPDKGPVAAYNNVLYRVGTGPDPQGQLSNYSCIYAGDSNGSPKTPVEIYNNTCYDGGSRGAAEGDAGAYTVGIPMHFTNNLTFELPGESYFSKSTLKNSISMVTGSSNLWFGVSGAPSQTNENITVDPLLVNPTAFDFHLQAASPAIDAGATVHLGWDVDGVQRPQGPKFDIGAYEFSTGITLPKPNPPTNLTVVVK
jgi:hypothetical protein